MEFTSRFLFHGTASALGGRIVRRDDRPVDVVIESTCESSLTPVGGRSSAKDGPKRYEDLVSFGSATTSAEGLFEDHAQAVEASYGRVREDALTAATTVMADIRDIVVGVKPRLTVKRLAVTVNARSPRGSGQPSIQPMSDQTVIDGVAIDGHELLVELNCPMYQEHDTYSKLLTAIDDERFVKEHGHCLFLTSGIDGRSTSPHGRPVVSRQTGDMHGTIVKNITWKNGPYPGATIDHHSITVPDFGRIYFGEVLIANRARRVTMMRVKLGSPIGGDVAFANTEPNGGWS